MLAWFTFGIAVAALWLVLGVYIGAVWVAAKAKPYADVLSMFQPSEPAPSDERIDGVVEAVADYTMDDEPA